VEEATAAASAARMEVETAVGERVVEVEAARVGAAKAAGRAAVVKAAGAMAVVRVARGGMAVARSVRHHQARKHRPRCSP
jgi:hypothetical protein